MKISKLEKRLKKHAKITKSIMRSPFDTEREEPVMTKRNCNFKKILIIAAAALCVIGTSVFAAFHLMSAKETVNALGDSKLAQYFSKQGSVSDTVTDGSYKATVLGIASGENLSEFKSSSWDMFPERTYVVVAIEKADGSAMTFDDSILVTPLIQGLNPFQYNIFTMNGGCISDIIDGVLYRIIEFDSIEYFADREVYMAVLSEAFINNKSYSYDDATGEITPVNDYNGTNILIKLKLDKSKADPKKAKEYLDKLYAASLEADSSEPENESDFSSSESEAVDIYDSQDFNIDVNSNEETPTITITEK